jgi:hypothetical protein
MSDQPKRPDFLDGNNRYKLLYPVKYREGEEERLLETLQLRRLTMADRLILDEKIGYSEQVVRILGEMTGEMRVVLLKIDAADGDRIDQIFGYFLQPGTATGAIS